MSGAPPGGSRRFGLEEVLLAALALLSVVGVAVSNVSVEHGFRFWLTMVPVFAATSIGAGWVRERPSGAELPAFLRKQLLHWCALPVAVYLIYLLERTGRLNRADAGLFALVSLALTTFLAGVHFDWRLLVLGVFLALGAAAAAVVQEFFWLLLVLGAVALVAALLWRRRESS